MATLPGQGNLDVTKAFAYRWRRFPALIVVDLLVGEMAAFPQGIELQANACLAHQPGSLATRRSATDWNYGDLLNTLYIRPNTTLDSITLVSGGFQASPAPDGNCGDPQTLRTGVQVTMGNNATTGLLSILGESIQSGGFDSASCRLITSTSQGGMTAGSTAVVANGTTPSNPTAVTFTQPGGTVTFFRGPQTIAVPASQIIILDNT